MKNNLGYIRDILDHISHIENFLFEVSEEELYQNKEKEFAVIRSFEVIGEAAKKISEDFRIKYPEIPWRKMSGFRDVLIHDYNRIIAEVLWNSAKNELPQLKSNLLQILENES